MNTAAGQHWDPERYRRDAGFVAEQGLPVVALLAPRNGERILDIGCGEGTLSRVLVDAGCDVVGIDSSENQIRRACEDGLNAHLMDAQSLEFQGEFDAVFTNAALHWMKDADAVITGVHRALRPGGRFVGEFGGHGNVAALRTALRAVLSRAGIDPDAHDPWFFPTPADYRSRLDAAGFRVRFMDLFDRPTPLPGDIEGWLDTFGESFLKPLNLSARAAAVGRIRTRLRADLMRPDGVWVADYVRLRFHAERVD